MSILVLFAASFVSFLYFEARQNRGEVRTDEGRQS
jgi:hypothetical protein